MLRCCCWILKRCPLHYSTCTHEMKTAVSWLLLNSTRVINLDRGFFIYNFLSIHSIFMANINFKSLITSWWNLKQVYFEWQCYNFLHIYDTWEWNFFLYFEWNLIGFYVKICLLIIWKYLNWRNYFKCEIYFK